MLITEFKMPNLSISIYTVAYMS